MIIGHTETSSWIDTPTQTKHTAGIVVVDAIGAALRHTTVTIEPTHGQSASAAEQDA